MRRISRLLLLVAAATVVVLVLPSIAQAGHTTDPRTKNMRPLGHIFEPAVTGGFGGASPNIHRRGLDIFKLSGKTLARRIKLGHLNPQTQEFSLLEQECFLHAPGRTPVL
jgi:hypothetical protein